MKSEKSFAVLTRILVALLFFSLALMLLIKGLLAPGIAQSERQFEDRVPNHLPIKVKIRAEKERATKDLSNERWHRDLEIEVKNAGDKPIYYISLILEMPEIKVGGNPVTFILRYGERSLFGDSKGRARPEDVPLKPKDTLILRLEDRDALAWEQWTGKESWSQPKKVLIIFEQLNFGDGTGFFGDTGAPWPLPKRGQLPGDPLSRRASDRIDDINHQLIVPNDRVGSRSILIGGASVSLWPTSFRSAESMNSRFTSLEREEPAPDSCCSDNCRFVYIYEYQNCYYCSSLHHADEVACPYEGGVCATLQQDSVLLHRWGLLSLPAYSSLFIKPYADTNAL